MTEQIRLFGPYGPEDQARLDAAKLAVIQTRAWTEWLVVQGVTRDIIEATLESDVSNPIHLDAREQRLREAMVQTNRGFVIYLGAFNTSGHIVGFAKFCMSQEKIPEKPKQQRLVCELLEIDVYPGYQGRENPDPANHNFARRMMYRALSGIEDPQAIIRLQVLASNTRARRLYEHLGLVAVDETQVFEFENAAGDIVHQEPHLVMQGNAQNVHQILAADLLGDY